MVISYRQFGIAAAQNVNVQQAGSNAAQGLKLEISGLKQKIDQLNASFLAEQAARIKAEGERDSARATVNQRDGELATARTAISQRDTAIRDRDATIVQKDNTISTVVRERDDARGTLAQRTNELNARISDLNATAASLDQARRVADMVPGLRSQLDQISAAFAAAVQERDLARGERDTLAGALNQRTGELGAVSNELSSLQSRFAQAAENLKQVGSIAERVPALEQALRDAGAIAEAATREVENQRSIGQRMLDEANKTAEDRMARAMERVGILEAAQSAAQQASADLQEKLRLLDQQYTEQLAAQAQAAQAAAEAAQAELQKARDACAADLGAAASAKEQVDAMLAAAQDEASKCQVASKKSASTAAPGVSPILALVGGVIAGFAAGKMKR